MVECQNNNYTKIIILNKKLLMKFGFSRLDGRFIWVMTVVIIIISIATLYAHTLVSRSATQTV